MDMSFINKSALSVIFCLIVLCLVSSTSYATNITNPTVTGTKITTGKQTQPSVDADSKYDRKPITDRQLEEVLIKETKRLNALFQSSIRNVVVDTDKFGDPNMVLLASDESKSKHIQEVIEIESNISGENRKRQIEEMIAQAKYKQGQITKEQLDNQVLRSVFPVQTSMKPTRLPSRTVKLSKEAIAAITRPIAIIGSDRYSLAWFKANLGAIRRLNAAVIVTEVKSLTDFQAINTFAPDLMYQPMDATEFLKLVGVGTYPILLTKEGGIQ
jgi:integrating conjugative element protein (TIGR03765 family)